MLRLPWLALLLSLMPLTLGGEVAAQQWYEYRPPGAGYRMEYPGVPKSETQTTRTAAGPVTVTFVIWARETGAFTSTHTVLSPTILLREPQTALDGARDGAVRQVNGRLRDERRLTIDGAPARRFFIDAPQNRVSLSLLVLKGRVLYQAAYIGRPGTETAPEVERFIGSLRLVER